MMKRIERLEGYASDDAQVFFDLLKRWCNGHYATNKEIQSAIGNQAYKVFDAKLGIMKRDDVTKRTQALHATLVHLDKAGSLLRQITEEENKELKRKLAKLMSEE